MTMIHALAPIFSHDDQSTQWRELGRSAHDLEVLAASAEPDALTANGKGECECRRNGGTTRQACMKTWLCRRVRAGRGGHGTTSSSHQAERRFWRACRWSSADGE